MPRTSIGFQFVKPFPLIMLKGIGWELNTSRQYIWNGRSREDEHCLFQYSVSGQGEIEINGKVYELKAGDAFLIEIPGEHCYRLPSYSKEWEVLYLEFSKEALPYWRQLLAITEPVISIQADSSLLQSAWSLYELAVKDQIDNVYQCSGYAYRFLMELFDHCYRHQLAQPLPSKIELCKQFIETNYRESIGLEEMSHAAGLSKFHLTRQFEKKLGVSPTRYLTEVRLEKASSLLLTSKATLESIAQEVGFSSANYFGKVFEKNMGVTPTEFRKSNHSYDIHRVLYK